MSHSLVSGSFYLSKWYLDFVDKNGLAMIFYAANLKWYGISVKYSSWLKSTPDADVKVKQSFRQVQMPQQVNETISWQHSGFNLSGVWRSREKNLKARIVNLPQGFLDWNCLQPSSDVTLTFDDKIMKGRGYAEQLILTVAPWQIPMDSLRWGRFLSAKNCLVWIELMESTKQQWLWWNGEKQTNIEISDNHIKITDRNLDVSLDCRFVLESEKKIYSVVEKLVRYLPGFKNAIPIKFLFADEHKWLSNGLLVSPTVASDKGMAIHEYVNFQPKIT